MRTHVYSWNLPKLPSICNNKLSRFSSIFFCTILYTLISRNILFCWHLPFSYPKQYFRKLISLTLTCLISPDIDNLPYHCAITLYFPEQISFTVPKNYGNRIWNMSDSLISYYLLCYPLYISPIISFSCKLCFELLYSFSFHYASGYCYNWPFSRSWQT